MAITPKTSMRRIPSDKSKEDIEDRIKDLDARLAEAPEIAVDGLKAQRAVWVKRLAEWDKGRAK